MIKGRVHRHVGRNERTLEIEETPLSPPASPALLQTSPFQESNRANGARMSLLKESASTNRLPADGSESRKLFITVGWTKSEHLPKSDELRTGRLAFVEDFTLEHSIRGLRMTATEISSIF